MRQFRIGTLFTIPIKLDLTFLIVLPLFAWIIGTQIEALAAQLDVLFAVEFDTSGLTAGLTPWILGSAAAIGLFVGVILHELGHSLVAMHYGYDIDSITLWIFGGIAQFTEIPEDWRHELTIALAGPAISILIGVGCYFAFIIVPGTFIASRFVIGYLALMNLVLAAFNLLPGFPMDGGRVLRALLARGRPFAQATKIAAEVGKGFAFILGLVGLLGFNIILIGIAFFIYIGAASEAQRVVMKAAFEGVSVRDVMTPSGDIHTVTPETTVAELIERMFSERHTGYPVMENGELVGLVTLEDAREVRPVERDAYHVKDIMTRDLQTIDVRAEAMDAFTNMQENGIGRLLVLDGGDFAGLVTRTDLMTALDIIQTGGTVGGSTMTGAGIGRLR